MSNRDDQKPPKIFTDICFETPTQANPYLADKRYLRGYDIETLITQINPVDVLFLQFTGELPASKAHQKILEMLMVYLAMPSPRESASRAAIACGVSKTNAEHILPIGLISAGGDNTGALEVQRCYQWLTANLDNSPVEVANQIIEQWQPDGETHPCAGFGQLYGDVDALSGRIFAAICEVLPDGATLQWLKSFNDALNEHQLGILEVGLAAGVFHQLAMRHRESVGLYQLLKAPGLLAYGMEQTHKPVSTMPMLEDSQYELKD